jgi:valyl-tRNA synthetase
MEPNANEQQIEAPKEISKSQLKKLAKGKGKPKEKPDWNSQPKKEKKVKIAPSNVNATYINPTPKGEKKDLSNIPMADGYHPSMVESAWQDWWEASGFYTCDPQDAMSKTSRDEKFVLVIPPPNVTGSLHLGHALTAAVEDTLTRWHRMKGHATLYVPGMFVNNCDRYLSIYFVTNAWVLWAATRTYFLCTTIRQSALCNRNFYFLHFAQ